MAYIDASDVSEIRKALKIKFPKYKFSCKKDGKSTIMVSILSGPTDFSDIIKQSYLILNEYYLEDYAPHTQFLSEVLETIKTGSSNKWYDNSDIQSDYFNIAFYIHLTIGSFDKPYQVKG